MTTTLKNPVIYAPVYIPNTPDCEYNMGEQKLSAKKIKYLATTFNKYKIIDLQHEYSKRLLHNKKPIQRGELLGSYITNTETKLKGLDGLMRTYPAGTWIVKIKITDPLAMKLYYQGKLSGVSATAKKRKDADFLVQYVSAKSKQKIPKRILLSDIKDPVVFTISLVKKPCVYGAKFCNKSCMILNNDKMENNSMSIKDMITEKLKAALDDVDIEQALAESQKEDIVDETETETNDVVETNDTVPETDPTGETETGGTETGGTETTDGTEGTEGTEEEGSEETIEGWDDSEDPLDESRKTYLTRDEAKSLFNAGLQSVKSEIESIVEENVTEAISALQESQKEALGYITKDEAKSIFDSEFEVFQKDLESSLRERQEESIKQFSKTIDSHVTPTPTPEPKTNGGKVYEGRDAYGCKIR